MCRTEAPGDVSKKNRARSLVGRVLQRVSPVSERVFCLEKRMTRGRTPMMSSVGGYSRAYAFLSYLSTSFTGGDTACARSRSLTLTHEYPLPLYCLFSLRFSSLLFASLRSAPLLVSLLSTASRPLYTSYCTRTRRAI